MTDKQSDEQQEQVRRLLAEARHDEPMPADVAERLDAVIAGLADEPGRSATVVRLADRRRRAARMLVAAAAVVVVGVGGAQFVRGLSGSGESESATAGSAADEPAAVSGEEAAPEDSAGGDDGRGTLTRPYELRSQRFSRDAEALQDYSASVVDPQSTNDEDGAIRGGATYSQLRRATKQSVCDPGDWGNGGFFAVVYDGTPGWMVLRPPAGDTQVADLFLCGSDQAVRSVTLPVR